MKRPKNIFNESITIRKSTQGEYHPKIASTYINLGNLSKDMRNLSEAKSYYEISHTFNLKIYGPKHIKIAQDYENFASVSYLELKNDEALQYYHQCVEIRRDFLRSDHHEITRILNAIQFIEKKTKKKLKTDQLDVENSITQSYGSYFTMTF